MVAGAVGTLALDATTYLDIALRGRAPSTTPEQQVEAVEHELGLELGKHRRTGTAALMGYALGVTGGLAYGLLGGRRRIPVLVAGLGLGGAVMVASAASMTLSGVTDPREWGVEGWLADVVPHAVYGVVTAAVFERYS